MSAQTEAIRFMARTVAETYRAKARDGIEPPEALHTAATLLGRVDWSAVAGTDPPAQPVTALRHLPVVLALMAEGEDRAVGAALRSCLGFAPWQTFYADSDWSHPFLDEIACASLVGPTGIVWSDDVALGLFLLGPHTTYREHAHGLDEIYYVLAGSAEWGFDREDNRRTFGPGSLVHTAPDQRHDIRTGSEPILCAYTWTNDPAAPTYHRSGGPWGSGEKIEPPLVVLS